MAKTNYIEIKLVLEVKREPGKVGDAFSEELLQQRIMALITGAVPQHLDLGDYGTAEIALVQHWHLQHPQGVDPRAF